VPPDLYNACESITCDT